MIALLRPFIPGGAAGLAILAVLVGVYQMGINAERKRGEAAELRVRIETMQADRRHAEAARISAEDKAAELTTLTRQQEEALDALRTELEARPLGDRQRADGAALDRLYPNG